MKTSMILRKGRLTQERLSWIFYDLNEKTYPNNKCGIYLK